MAFKFAASDINDLLDCPICMDRFSQVNLPKLLPCTHNVCVICLKGLVVGHYVRCPICRKNTIVLGGDVTTLTTNLPTLQFADIRPLAKCQVCNEEGKTSTCFHCEKKICTDCLREHTEETESNMRQLQKDIDKSLKSAEDFKQIIGENMASVELSAAIQLFKITSEFEEMTGKLEARRDLLMQSVNAQLENVKLQCELVDHSLQQKLKTLKSVRNKVTDQITDVKFKLNRKTIEETNTKVTTIIAEIGETLPKSTVNFSKVIVDILKDSLVTEIGKWGNVTTDESISVQYNAEQVDTTSLPTKEINSKPTGDPVKRRPAKNMKDPNYAKRGKLVERVETSGPPGDSQQKFGWPGGAVIDEVGGEVFVADGEKNKIHVFSPSWEHLRSFGEQGSELGQFEFPWGVAVNSKSEIIVCDNGNNRCQMFTAEGKLVRQFGQSGSGTGGLTGPVDVTVDLDDNMYVTSYGAANVKKYDSKGKFSKTLPTHGKGGPGGIEYPCFIDWHGTSYVVYTKRGIFVWDSMGEFIGPSGIYSNANRKHLISPKGVSFDQRGNILVLDMGDSTVKVFTPMGKLLTKFPVAECKSKQYNYCYLLSTPEGGVVISDTFSKSLLCY